MNLPPANKDIEAAVLGSLMMSRDILYLSMDRLFDGLFYTTDHREIFTAIRTLFDNNQQVDVMTVFQQLLKSGSKISAFDLTKLQQAVTTDTVLETHIMILAELYLKREVGRIGFESAGKSFNDDQDAFDLANTMASELEKSQQNVIGGKREDISGLVHKVLVQHAEVKNTGVLGLKTGLGFIDDTIGGLVSPDLIIIAARPGQGKTALALSITENLTVLKKIPGAWFSLEMDGVQLTRRLLSMHSGVDHARIRNGRTLPDEEEKLHNSAGVISSCPLFIEDSPVLNIRDIRVKAHVMKRKHGVKYIIVDYLQLMTGTDKKNREQEVSEISRTLKVISKELGVPLIALSQLNRTVETRADKMPNLSDLRESGAIEQDADEVIFIMRPEYYLMEEPVKIKGIEYDPKGLVVLNIAKNRHGDTGNQAGVFDAPLMKFSNHSPF